MLESVVQSRNLVAGVMFGAIGVFLIVLAGLLLVASAAGCFGPQTD